MNGQGTVRVGREEKNGREKKISVTGVSDEWG